MREVVQEQDPKKTDDLILIALTKGKRHARFAMESLQAEREGVALAREASALQREAHRDKELERLQRWVIFLTCVATLAAVAQVVVAVLNHAK